jgi:putative inorganic carbon (HCO3(-)) transporter
MVTVGIIILAAFFLSATHFLLAARRQQDARTRRVTLTFLLLFFAGALALGFGLGWKTLKPRMAQLSEGFDTREAMYDAARPMAADYPLFGTGPGTFEPVFQLYRKSMDTYWPAQLHNDWLETRITFGWLGSGLIALAFIVVVLRWFARGGIHGGRRFIILIWLALAGCLVHARYDFPFQIHSIVFLFLVQCAILLNLTRRP